MGICMPCKVGQHVHCNIRDFRGQCCCQRQATRSCPRCGGNTEMSHGDCRPCQQEMGGGG